MQYADYTFEEKLWAQGLTLVAGLDEAGRGAWAGPLVAGAAILKSDELVDARLQKLRDSKTLSHKQRDAFFEQVTARAHSWGIGVVEADELDRIGITRANQLAMTRALESLNCAAEHLLVDAWRLPVDIPQTPVIRGDARVATIAAAAIVAKVSRDRMLVALDTTYPGYGFADHKGYGTAMHRDAIARLGPSPTHRLSFAPLHAYRKSQRNHV